MKTTRPLANPRLVSLLADLLAEESLPALDRWFSAHAKRASWPVSEQKRLWDALRRALTRAYGLLEAGNATATAWPRVRAALQGRATEWAIRADLAPGDPNLANSGIPPWLSGAMDERSRLSAWSASEVRRFLGSQERASPVHVRFLEGPGGGAAENRLQSSGFLEPSDIEGIKKLVGGRGLESGDDWKQGLVEIQDASSQLSLKRLGLRPGMRVWDACAGRGGKTLLAARELRGKGAIVATDVAEAKLKTLKDRVRRSGWQNIRLLGWDGLRLPDFGPEVRAKGGFDRVIVDAPCTASGTWRRDPEGRFRLTPEVLKELINHQNRLIRLGWEALRTGGKLAYITCSWLPAENEHILGPFLEESGGVLAHHDLLGLPAFDANTVFVAVVDKP